MSKILVIARVFPPQVGGSGRFLWEIYRRQRATDVCAAAGYSEGSEAFDRGAPFAVERAPLDGGSWGLLPLGFGRYVANFARVWRIARRRRATAVHAATLLPEGFLAWMLKRAGGLPYLCFVHGEELGYTATSRELSWMADRVLRGASRIIANSENTRDLIVRSRPYCADKIAVVTPGVDSDRFRPAAVDANVRARLGWTGRRVVLTVGRLQERKGHDRLIEALPAVRRAVPDVLYAIVGAGERREMLESLALSTGVLDCVKFHGELADDALLECYQQCDLMALPNRQVNGDIEGFGMVLVEAQACGRPVLAGASGGTAETLHPGVTGRLVDCTRAEPLAAALIEMLSDPQGLAQMGEAGRAWATERFDWSAVVERANEAFRVVQCQRTPRGPAVLQFGLDSDAPGGGPPA